MVKRIIIYALIGAVITIGPLYYINDVLLSDSAGATIQTSSVDKPAEVSLKATIPDDARYLSLAYNSTNICYVYDGRLYVKNAADDTVIETIEEKSPVIYALSLDDRNIIMYFTYDGSKLGVKTYNIDQDEKTDQKSISVNNLYEIRDVKYSSITNVIYIDVKTGNENKSSDRIYKVDIMKNITVYADNKKISGIALLKNKDSFIYQDSNSNVYIKGKTFNYKNNKKFVLLGTDSKDCIYLSPKLDLGEVLIVQNGAVVGEKHLEDSEYTGIISGDGNVYAVYKDHMINLSDDTRTDISPDTALIGIRNGSMMLRNTNSEVTIKKAS
jgi:hypothetical protein